ncbi:hypothetical protein [Carboxylicivirga marina]|uniref:hypothetical protein n=1 Tax=Carboxylicivirga marina TaxID=2800988 RepID=UPI0025935CFD|nr:hypothetical protein [uncultured Carboxylicivirga sp.]
MAGNDFWTPKKFKLKNEDGLEIEINSSFIFYINVSKEVKTIHLTEPASLGGKKVWQVHWKTRKYGVRKLLELLSGKGFLQVNKYTIIRNIHISGRDADWKYIYITMPFKRTIGEGFESYKNIALPLGRSYAYQFKEHVFKSLLTVKNSEGDIFFISPIDIVLIELSRGVKTLYLNKPTCRNDKNNYILEWHERRAVGDLLSEEELCWFIQVHRRYYVRIDYPFIIVKEGNKVFLNLNRPFIRNIENHEVYDKQIPIGKNHKTQCWEIFGRR